MMKKKIFILLLAFIFPLLLTNLGMSKKNSLDLREHTWEHCLSTPPDSSSNQDLQQVDVMLLMPGILPFNFQLTIIKVNKDASIKERGYSHSNKSFSNIKWTKKPKLIKKR